MPLILCGGSGSMGGSELQQGVTFVHIWCIDVLSIDDFLSSDVGHLLFPGVVQSSSIFLSGFAN